MQQKKHFIRKKEDFVCQVCGTKVIGTGYTNHCPNCLYSLHVDENVPGDRLSTCGGLMEPVGIQIESGKYVVSHKCQKCGKQTRNKITREDNFETVLRVAGPGVEPGL